MARARASCSVSHAGVAGAAATAGVGRAGAVAALKTGVQGGERARSSSGAPHGQAKARDKGKAKEVPEECSRFGFLSGVCSGGPLGKPLVGLVGKEAGTLFAPNNANVPSLLPAPLPIGPSTLPTNLASPSYQAQLPNPSPTVQPPRRTCWADSNGKELSSSCPFLFYVPPIDIGQVAEPDGPWIKVKSRKDRRLYSPFKAATAGSLRPAIKQHKCHHHTIRPSLNTSTTQSPTAPPQSSNTQHRLSYKDALLAPTTNQQQKQSPHPRPPRSYRPQPPPRLSLTRQLSSRKFSSSNPIPHLHRRCINCLSFNHRASTCREPTRCFRCLKFGHKAKQCKAHKETECKPATKMQHGAVQGRIPHLLCFLPYREEAEARARLLNHAVIAEVVALRDSDSISAGDISILLARQFGGSPFDYPVARFHTLDFIMMLPRWIDRDAIIHQEFMEVGDAVLRCEEWNANLDSHPHDLSCHAWIKLQHLPFECWSISEVSTIVSGFGQFLYADGPSRRREDLRAYRCYIRCEDMTDIPHQVKVTVRGIVHWVDVDIESWAEDNPPPPFSPPPTPPPRISHITPPNRIHDELLPPQNFNPNEQPDATSNLAMQPESHCQRSIGPHINNIFLKAPASPRLGRVDDVDPAGAGGSGRHGIGEPAPAASRMEAVEGGSEVVGPCQQRSDETGSRQPQFRRAVTCAGSRLRSDFPTALSGGISKISTAVPPKSAGPRNRPEGCMDLEVTCFESRKSLSHHPRLSSLLADDLFEVEHRAVGKEGVVCSGSGPIMTSSQLLVLKPVVVREAGPPKAGLWKGLMACGDWARSLHMLRAGGPKGGNRTLLLRVELGPHQFRMLLGPLGQAVMVQLRAVGPCLKRWTQPPLPTEDPGVLDLLSPVRDPTDGSPPPLDPYFSVPNPLAMVVPTLSRDPSCLTGGVSGRDGPILPQLTESPPVGPAIPPVRRTSHRLATSEPASILSKAMLRKAALSEGGYGVRRNSVEAKISRKSHLCGVNFSDVEVASFVGFLAEQEHL